jgi:hypothetical protein
LLALADFANPKGECFPSQTRLAKMCNTSVRSVFESLKRLHELGEVFILPYRGRRGCHIYMITLTEESSTVEGASTEETSTSSNGTGGQVEVGAPTSGSLQREDRNTSSTEPLEPSKEPSCASGVEKSSGPEAAALDRDPDQVLSKLSNNIRPRFDGKLK